ncbi:hypothetical protein [Nocardia sp. NPDC052112]|uniref:hypothetical protein n=1 Tax=Nocardia sp. NPDC052112 TaxID=3155646 RepID=UPI00342A0FAD
MGYRRLVTQDLLVWSIVSLAGKSPIAMAPLALVFLVRSQGYALGATLPAAYVLGEVTGAAGAGMWLRQYGIRPHLAIGAAGFAGLALGRVAAAPLQIAFAIASALGAFCYGLRPWPGTVRRQGLVLLIAMAGCVGSVVVMPGVGIAIALTAAGLLQSRVMIARNIALCEHLPADLAAAGYSVMYAAGAIGYSLAATVAAVALPDTSGRTAVLGGVTITLALTAIRWLAERSPSSGGLGFAPSGS